MSVPSPLKSALHYQGKSGSVLWEGRTVKDPKAFTDFIHDVVNPRVRDTVSGFDAEMRALATTGMATEFIEKLLNAVPEPEGWEIGEALAECALQHDCGREVHWPWNTVRDRRTPRASLPGADLVGFCCQANLVHLLLGEVKTSSDGTAPPNVMYGGSGMNWQLQQSATRLDIQHALIRWLHARCRSAPYRELFENAVSRYLSSEGKEIVFVGVLIRDTEPNENDLKGRASALAKTMGPLRVELLAWYLPVPIDNWPKLLSGKSS